MYSVYELPKEIEKTDFIEVPNYEYYTTIFDYISRNYISHWVDQIWSKSL